MLLKRILTAAALLVPLVAALAAGGILLRLVVILLFIGINWEFARVSSRNPISVFAPPMLLPIGYLSAGLPGLMLAAAAAIMLVFLLLTAAVEKERHELAMFQELGGRMLAVAYPGLLGFMTYVAVDGLSDTRPLAWLCFCVIATDTVAFFGGRAVGGPKMAPRISPGKTASGALFGLAGAVVASFASSYLLGLHWHWAVLGAGGLAVGFLAEAGDLAESLVKRAYGVKDMGTILPGHGGLLDRVDGFVFAAPILFFFRLFTG